LELVEQALRREMLALQSAEELEQVLVRDNVGGRCREFSEQVIDHRSGQPVALRRQIAHTIWRIADHLSGGRAPETLEIDRRLEQRVERGGDEDVEVG